jgi:trehalose 6-phosphate phosphatase
VPLNALPAPGETALLLDLDGTLLDIAPTPGEVRVPPSLPGTLARLRDHLGGALAVVTGRSVEQVEALLGDVPRVIAGEHGGAIRPAPGAGIVRVSLPDPPVEWIIEAARIVEHHPGSLLEQKQRGFVFHYRQAPEHGPALGEAAAALIAAERDRFLVMPAHMAWEVRPRGADKASAVQAVMLLAPFEGRRPIFVGDDVTDRDGMRAAVALGGAGLWVPDVFGDAAGVRAWLDRAADALDRGAADWPAQVTGPAQWSR